jgi:phosphatidylcholine synthase
MNRLFAWLVHALTASGAVFAFLALLAIEQGDWRLALIWLAAALAIDTFDGTLARRAQVKTYAPRIDGDSLDLIIDYLNYVFVPAMIIWRAELVPAPFAPWLVAAILISALYNFTRRDMKTEDNYFRGFPALWNVVAFYLFVARPGPEAGAVIVVALAALTFTSVPVVHPFRVREHGRWLPVLASAWAAVTLALLWPDWSQGARTALAAASGLLAVLLLGLGFLRGLRGPSSISPPV